MVNFVAVVTNTTNPQFNLRAYINFPLLLLRASNLLGLELNLDPDAKTPVDGVDNSVRSLLRADCG